jgi:Glycosyltransferases, probably involved in cell wall biogenesis
MARPSISLCTYTFNDAELARGLLADLAGWTVRPDEIVVVDDGSRAPFALAGLEDLCPAPRILRLHPNQGITRAKHAGLSAARGDILLSVDCDMRLAPDWLETVLPHLSRPGVGLAGGSVLHAAGEDLVSRFLRRFGDNHNLDAIGPVDFIPGNAFLIRRALWEELGGFSGHDQPVCEDHYLVARLAERGHTLYSDARAKALQTRRIGRAAMCRRIWDWCSRAVTAQLLPGERLVTYIFEVLGKPMLDRFAISVDMGEPLFLYLDLLYLAHAALSCLDHALARGQAAPQLRDGFLRRLARLFDGYPRLWAVFRADLTAAGHPVLMPAEGDEQAWADFFLFADFLRESGLFTWLERHGVDALLHDDRQGRYHFSSYAQGENTDREVSGPIT